MTDSTPAEDDLARIFAEGPSHHVGSFRYLIAEDSWEWSESVARMHGYEPGTVTPTTELLLQHKHPEDKEQIAAVLAAVRSAGEPFSSRHRIIDTGGNIKHVAVVGDRLLDEDGNVLGTSGFYLDLSDAIEEDVRAAVDEVMAHVSEARAVIEQAKGVLMLAYTIPADRAFEILAWRSQETNVKLRDLAEQLVAEVVTPGVAFGDRRDFDHLFMTLHQRA